MDGRPPLAVLSGVRVLSFTQFLLGPSGVQFIADLGADVIKIEPPGGTLWERNWAGSDLYLNGVSAFFLSTHRNQRSLTLDLKHPDGLAVARRLVEGADVLVQNFRPGVMARLGLGWETVRAWNPRLVYVSASGYGETSPYRDRPGQDLLLQALSGLASISGRAGQPPTPVGTAVVDQHGATLLAMGVLAALLERGAHRPGGPRRGEHAAGGARSPARDRHVLPERRAAGEEPHQPRQHVPPRPLRLLRDPGRLAGPVDVAAQGPAAGARPAGARAVQRRSRTTSRPGRRSPASSSP